MLKLRYSVKLTSLLVVLTLGHNSPGQVRSSSNIGMVPGLSGYDSYEHTPRNERLVLKW
jgi:hypothetical protein